MSIKSLSIRIDENVLDKLHVIADYEGRSANSQINILIRDCIEKYEAKHGEEVPEEIIALAQQMQSARLEKDYAKADALRAEIIAKGYTVMISKDGVTVKKSI